MKDLRINVDEHRDAQKYITRAEHEFAAALDATLDEVLAGGERVIALAGPTCSGKTTTANKLTDKIKSMGKNAVMLSIDDFFHDRADRNNVSGDAPDYDSVKAIDLDLLSSTVRALLRGETVQIPRFDFTITSRAGYTPLVPDERDIYIFEGIQAVYPEVTSLFGEDYLSIFISVADGVRYRGEVLDPNEIRLLRRIVRDYKFRGATAEFSIHLWQTVRSNEEENIFPNSHDCDVYINSLLRYEPFVLARHAKPLLEDIPADSRYKAYADELAGKLEAFECPFFEDGMIPKDSVFREFIG